MIRKPRNEDKVPNCGNNSISIFVKNCILYCHCILYLVCTYLLSWPFFIYVKTSQDFFLLVGDCIGVVSWALLPRNDFDEYAAIFPTWTRAPHYFPIIMKSFKALRFVVTFRDIEPFLFPDLHLNCAARDLTNFILACFLWVSWLNVLDEGVTCSITIPSVSSLGSLSGSTGA